MWMRAVSIPDLRSASTYAPTRLPTSEIDGYDSVVAVIEGWLRVVNSYQRMPAIGQ